MLQLRNNAASNGFKSSARLLETIVIEVFSRGAAYDVMLKGFEQWSQFVTMMNDVEKRIVLNSLYIRSITGSKKHYVDSTIGECHLTELHAETKTVYMKVVPRPPGDRCWTQRKSPKTRARAKAPNSEGGRKKNAQCDSPHHGKCLNPASPAPQTHDRLSTEIDGFIEAME